MINHWLNKKVGTVRLTNMHAGCLTYDLPKVFYVQSMHDNMLRCTDDKNDCPLEWIDESHIKLSDKIYELKYCPAFSMVLYDYVFTIKTA